MYQADKIELPTGLKVIKEYVFQGCIKMRTVISPQGLLSIETSAFNSCSSLERVVIPSSVNNLRPYSFKDCTQLGEVVINDGLEHGLCNNIYNGTFSGCTSLQVNIPSSVMDISCSAFAGCDNCHLSLMCPQEIIDFILGSNTFWWNLCSIKCTLTLLFSPGTS